MALLNFLPRCWRTIIFAVYLLQQDRGISLQSKHQGRAGEVNNPPFSYFASWGLILQLVLSQESGKFMAGKLWYTFRTLWADDRDCGTIKLSTIRHINSWINPCHKLHCTPETLSYLQNKTSLATTPSSLVIPRFLSLTKGFLGWKQQLLVSVHHGTSVSGKYGTQKERTFSLPRVSLTALSKWPASHSDTKIKWFWFQNHEKNPPFLKHVCVVFFVNGPSMQAVFFGRSFQQKCDLRLSDHNLVRKSTKENLPFFLFFKRISSSWRQMIFCSSMFDQGNCFCCIHLSQCSMPLVLLPRRGLKLELLWWMFQWTELKVADAKVTLAIFGDFYLFKRKNTNF